MGIGLAVALLLLVAGRGDGGEVRGRPVRLVRRRRRRLGRHDRRRQVPPRRLLRAAPRRRPLRRRPPEELHPRRAADRLRHPLRPLALDGARRHRHHPDPRHLVAHPPRRHRAAARGRQLERRLRRLRRCHRRPTSPRATSSPASPRRQPAFEDRLLCAKAESKSCSLEPGLLVGDAGADDHDRGRPAGRPPALGGEITAGGWRRGAQGVRLLGRRHRRRRSATAKRRSTAPASTSPSTPARRR